MNDLQSQYNKKRTNFKISNIIQVGVSELFKMFSFTLRMFCAISRIRSQIYIYFYLLRVFVCKSEWYRLN